MLKQQPYCYFFGFGSLLSTLGYHRRNMKYPPKDLYHYYEIKGFERGMYGIWNVNKHLVSYFGIIEKKNSSVIGAVAPIITKKDLISLLLNEGAISSLRCPIPVYEPIIVGRYNNKPLYTLLSPSSLAKESIKVRPANGYLENVFYSINNTKYKKILMSEVSDIIKHWKIIL